MRHRMMLVSKQNSKISRVSSVPKQLKLRTRNKCDVILTKGVDTVIYTFRIRLPTRQVNLWRTCLLGSTWCYLIWDPTEAVAYQYTRLVFGSVSSLRMKYKLKPL